MVSLMVAADGMEMTVISLLRGPLQKEFGLDDIGFSVLPPPRVVLSVLALPVLSVWAR